MGTTPKLAIPYVEPSDLLANFPASDKAQAQRLEALLSFSAWTVLPLASGWVGYSAPLVPQYRIEPNGMVRMRGMVKKSSGSIVNNDVPVVFPAAITPLREYTFNVVCTNTSSAAAPNIRMILKTDGSLLMLTAGANSPGGWFSVDNILYDWTQA